METHVTLQMLWIEWLFVNKQLDKNGNPIDLKKMFYSASRQIGKTLPLIRKTWTY